MYKPLISPHSRWAGAWRIISYGLCTSILSYWSLITRWCSPNFCTEILFYGVWASIIYSNSSKRDKCIGEGNYQHFVNIEREWEVLQNVQICLWPFRREEVPSLNKCNFTMRWQTNVMTHDTIAHAQKKSDQTPKSTEGPSSTPNHREGNRTIFALDL